MSGDACDDCGNAISDPLARTVRLTVDRSQIDAQRLCPECFAEWVERYDEYMGATNDPTRSGGDEHGDGDDIIVD